MENKRPSRITPAGALLLLMACAAPRSVDAFQVFKVDPFCPDPSVYPTIQAAVDAAAAYSDADHADYVWISDNTDIKGYKQQHIVVNDPESVIIEGGFFDCTDFDPGSDQTSVSGAGNDGGPVFEIVGNGNNVYLGNLFITGAQRGGGDYGGGVNFTGRGELDIAQTTIFNNKAGYGAGINVSPSGGQAIVKLMHGAIVYLNSAYGSGGGIRLEGDARLLALEPNLAVNGNTAAAYGGGILILGPARADVGAPDGGFGGSAIAANLANYGGGVAAIDIGAGGPVFRSFAYDASHPTTIAQNRAEANGGAVYLEGMASACLFSPRIRNNIADDGAALYHSYTVIYDTGDPFNRVNGGGFYINFGVPQSLGADCGPETVSELGGTKSCYAAACNEVSGQQTKHADDTPSSGATIYGEWNDLQAARLRLQNNIAGNLIRNNGGLYSSMALARCLITDNSISGDLIVEGRVYLPGPDTVENCTIANNVIGGTNLVDFGNSSTAQLHDDILAQPGKAAVTYAQTNQTFDAAYILAADTAGLPVNSNPSIIAGMPNFVAAGSGDYHLRATSPGVDFAPTTDLVDLDGSVGTKDLPQIANKFGAADLGAYELQTAFACDASADAVFCDGFGP